MKDLALVDEKEIALIERVSGVFLKKGMKRVTMDDVAKELSVSKKTLYKYVKNRKELVMKSTYFHVQRDQSKVREIQAKNMAVKLADLAKENNYSICIHGKSYKPDVSYLDANKRICFCFKEFPTFT